MGIVMILLAVYSIMFAGFIIVGSIFSIGEQLLPLKAIEALVIIALTVPVIILAVLVIRQPIRKKESPAFTKEGDKGGGLPDKT